MKRHCSRYINGTSTLSTPVVGTGGGGDVVGPATATDNAVARFDASTGKLLQNSSVTVSDTGVVGATEFRGATYLDGAGVNGLFIPQGLGAQIQFKNTVYKGLPDRLCSHEADGTLKATTATLSATGRFFTSGPITTTSDMACLNMSATQALRSNDIFNLSNSASISLGNNAAGVVQFRGTAYKGPGYLKVDADGVISVQRTYPEELTFDASVLTAGTLTGWNSVQSNYSLSTVAGNVTVAAGGVNGLNTVDFALDAGISGTAALFPWKDFTVHMVLNISDVVNSSTFWSNGNYGDPSALVAWSLGTANYVHDGALGGHIPLGNNVSGQWAVLTWVKQSGANPHLTCYRNGSQIGSGDYFVNPIPTVDGIFGLGRNPGTNVGGSPLSMGEVRVFRKTQNQQEIGTNLDALITKWLPPNEVKLNATTNGTFVSYPKVAFRDSGGVPSNYGPNESFTISFDAGSATRTWRMTPLSFGFEHSGGGILYDRLGIQTSADGSTWTNASLTGFLRSATVAPPWSTTSATGDGWIYPATSVGSPVTGVALTFTTRFIRFIFISDNSTQLPGWDIAIQAVAL